MEVKQIKKGQRDEQAARDGGCQTSVIDMRKRRDDRLTDDVLSPSCWHDDKFYDV